MHSCFAKSLGFRPGSGGSSLNLPASSGVCEVVAPRSRSSDASGAFSSGSTAVSRGGDLPNINPHIFDGESLGWMGRSSLGTFLTHTFSTSHMLTSRARGRAGNRQYLYIGDVHLSCCSNTELARGKVWLVRKAMQWELAMGCPETIASMVHVVALAPLRVPEAWRVAWAMNDPTSATPATEVIIAPWAARAGPSCGVPTFNGGHGHFVPRHRAIRAGA